MQKGDNLWWLIIGILRGEVGMQKEDLDTSCSGGRSEGKGSAGEYSLTKHRLPPIVIG